jgi:CRP-like cAMP-binding protein
MIFPGSRLWYEGEASDLSLLTEEIKTSSFSGHIVLEFQDSLDLVIVSQGEFLKVVERIGPRMMTTKKYREIWGKCQIKQGRMYVFELPPALAGRLRGMARRRALASGSAGTCDLLETLREQKAAQLTGFIDCVTAEGRGLLELREGMIEACYFTEYHGLSWTGFDAFLRWHEILQQSLKPFSLSVSEYHDGEDHSHDWDALLAERLQEVRVPLRPTGERLFSVFGKTAFPGEIICMENIPGENVFHIIDGSVELSRMAGGTKQILGHVGQGSFVGLPALSGVKSRSLTAIAVSNCRYLTFGRRQMPLLFHNSPALASNLIRSVLSQLQRVTRRSELYRRDPLLKDLEYRTLQILNGTAERVREWLDPGELLSELSRTGSIPFTEIDRMISTLVQEERLLLSGGRIHLHPEE